MKEKTVAQKKSSTGSRPDAWRQLVATNSNKLFDNDDVIWTKAILGIFNFKINC